MSNLIAIRNPDNHNQVTLIESDNLELQKEITRIRKKEQYNGECACPKHYIWKCDGDCDCCEYHINHQPLSLDLEVENHHDCFSDGLNVEDMVADKIFFAELLSHLATLLPEAVEVGKLMEAGFSERESLERLGLNRSTYRSRLEKAKKQMKAKYGKIF